MPEMQKNWGHRLRFRDKACGKLFNKLTSVFHASVLLLTMNFVIDVIKVAADPRGDSRVDPQTTLTMLGRNSLSTT